MPTEKQTAVTSPGKGRVFRAKFQAPAQTLKLFTPEIVEALAAETGSKAIGSILAGGLKGVREMPEAAWDFSWDFSWDYSTKLEQAAQPQVQAER